MNTRKDCIFCNREEIKDDVLWESKNFFVKVGVGILAPGHIMLIPQKHFSCFGELPHELKKEFLSMKEDIFNKLKTNFSEPIIYEHGIYSQSVNHAHIHFIPSKSDFYCFKDLHKQIFRELKYTEINDIFEIKDVFKRDGSYCYLEEKGRKWIFFTKGLPERKYHFRNEFVKLTGLNELSDWRTISNEFKKKNEEWVRVTKEKLKSN